MSKDYEKIAREIESHISILVDYDVIDYQVGETLTEYVWRIFEENNNEENNNLATIHNLGEKNAANILGPVGSKLNRKASEEDPEEGRP